MGERTLLHCLMTGTPCAAAAKQVSYECQCESCSTWRVTGAPDLLEALEEIVQITDRDHVAWDRARAAIARAQGRE